MSSCHQSTEGPQQLRRERLLLCVESVSYHPGGWGKKLGGGAAGGRGDQGEVASPSVGSLPSPSP